MFPVIPDKESQLLWTRDLRFVPSHDVPEHLPDKDHLLDPQLMKPLIAPIKPSHPSSQGGALMFFLGLLTVAKGQCYKPSRSFWVWEKSQLNSNFGMAGISQDKPPLHSLGKGVTCTGWGQISLCCRYLTASLFRVLPRRNLAFLNPKSSKIEQSWSQSSRGQAAFGLHRWQGLDGSTKPRKSPF